MKSLVQEWLLEKRLWKGVLIALFLFVALTCFFHLKQGYVRSFELGEKSPNYLIAQVDFEFHDEEATLLLKQEAVRDLGPVYRIDEKEVQGKKADFESFLIHNPHWRSDLPTTHFDQIYRAAEVLSGALLEMRFVDEKTLSKMQELGLPTEDAYVYVPPREQLSVSLPKEFWEHAKQIVLPQVQAEEGAANIVLNFFQNEIWNLQEDIAFERNLRRIIQETIPPKMTKIRAGSLILEKGDTVTLSHLSMIQAMKVALGETRELLNPSEILGNAALSLVFLIAATLYLFWVHRNFLMEMNKVTLLAVIVVLILVIAKVTEYFLLHQQSHLVDFVRFPLFLPLAALLITVLLGSEICLFALFFLIAVLGIGLATEMDRFLAINFVGAIVALLAARQMHKRKQVFTASALVWVSCLPVIVAFNFFEKEFFNINLMTDMMSTFIFMVMTALSAVALLPLFESLFNVLTEMTLMEYMDPNNELLRRLSIEAPGTYQHCLVVGNLAETAARAIGANSLLCRVATLYHDIGKLFNPHYFTENQLGGFNIHQLLTPQESAQVIISHVAEGESMARKAHLPQSFIDIIREHHGTTLVYYFYCKQVELMKGDVMRVDQQKFRYPGPKPVSKEAAIIMIADTVEAASRSMEELSEEAISDMIGRLVAEKIEDGQFDECKLTFEELGIVKKTIAKTLSLTHHIRVKYPSRIA